MNRFVDDFSYTGWMLKKDVGILAQGPLLGGLRYHIVIGISK
jgi:hypothetical protein